MHAGDSCKPYRAAGQVLSFAHHREAQHVNESAREEEGTGKVHLEAYLGFGDLRIYLFFLYFTFFLLLFLTDIFPVCFLLFRSKGSHVILNLTHTCIHIKLNLVLWF